MVAETIQASVPHGVVCSRVGYEKKDSAEKDREETDEAGEIKRGLEDIAEKKKTLNDALRILSSFEANMLKEKENLSIDFMKQYLEYAPSQASELRRQLHACEEEERNLNRQLTEWREAHENALGVIELDVQAEADGEYLFGLTYYDLSAGWTPFYDIHVDSLENPVQVFLKGKVTQNTGEDWKNTEITLSTGNLQRSNNVPLLLPWLLRQQTPRPPMAPAAGNRGGAVNAETALLEKAALLEQPKRNRQPDGTSRNNSVCIEYRIPEPVRVDSGGSGGIVEATAVSLSAEYSYYITPKAENNAFLVALISDWEKADFIECDANVFLGNSFVGATHINPRQIEDVFSLSLGRDPRILVQRKQVRQYQSQKAFGNYNRKELAYQLRIKNGKNTRIRVVIKDQVPVSTDEKIKVELLNLSGGELNEKDGSLRWMYELEALWEVTLDVAFRVSWPQNYPFNL